MDEILDAPNQVIEGRLVKRRGSILVIVAIAIVVLVGLVGLVTDAGIVASTRHQMTSTAQVAALAAMATYLENLQNPQSSDPYKFAAEKALLRAEKLLSDNQPLGKMFLKNPGYGIKDLGLVGSTSGNSSAKNGKMVIGNYYALKPSSTTISASCNEKFPCFLDSSTPYLGNAIKLSVKLDDQNLLQTQFMRVLGIPSVGLHTTVFASLIPRNDAFLLDLSSSVVGDNYAGYGIPLDVLPSPACDVWYYPDYPQCVKRGSLSSMVVVKAEDQVNQPADYFRCTQGVGNCLGPFSGSTEYYYLCDSASSSSDPACLDYTLNTTPFGPFVHFEDRYRGRLLNFGKNLTNPITGNADYEPTLLVDYDNPQSASHLFLARPQPLISMLQSLGTAMNTISARSVSADRMNLTGFDTDIYEKRTTCATGSTDCDSRFVAPTDIQFDDLKVTLDLLQPGQATTINTDKFITNYGLVPLPMWTDIFMVLLDSLIQFNKLENVSSSKNSIFLLTDGVATCGTDGPGIGALLGSINGDLGHFLTTWINNRVCLTDYAIFNWGYFMLGKFIIGPKGSLIDYLKASRISVSVVLFGSGVSPHFLAKKSYSEESNPGCVTMEEAVVTQGLGFVNPNVNWDSDGNGIINSADATNEFHKMRTSDPTAKFLVPNMLFDILVKPTKGAWVPVLPPLPPLNSAGEGVNFSAMLEASCNNLAEPGDLVTGTDIDGDGAPDGIFMNGKQIIDGKGRVLYDPNGRTVKKQIEEAMKKVLTDPYVLVAPIGGAID